MNKVVSFLIVHIAGADITQSPFTHASVRLELAIIPLLQFVYCLSLPSSPNSYFLKHTTGMSAVILLLHIEFTP